MDIHYDYDNEGNIVISAAGCEITAVEAYIHGKGDIEGQKMDGGSGQWKVPCNNVCNHFSISVKVTRGEIKDSLLLHISPQT